MFVCLCNPFSDKKVREHLAGRDTCARVAEVYGACAGGEKPQCCSCLETLKEMVQSHNRALTSTAL